MTAPPPLTCDVCDAPAVGVASCSFGPISFAYCVACLRVGAEPLELFAGYVSFSGGFDALIPAMRDVKDATLMRLGKTEADWDALYAEVQGLHRADGLIG